ncbi:MAG: glycosyl hydrolase family 28-related protein [Terracidiphilus sp.]|jgi:hypothetical protein
MNKAALVFLFLSIIVGAADTGLASASTPPSTPTIGAAAPRFNVMQYGAVGDNSTDDTAAIQAAFDACVGRSGSRALTWNYGGIVEFPGPHSYKISSTINAYSGCQIEGTIGNTGGSGASPSRIVWNGAAAGTVYHITQFTAATNSKPLYTLSSPNPVTQPNLATFTVSGSSVPVVGQWVDIEGLSTSAGTQLNRVTAQVAAISGSTFTVTFPSAITAGTYTDSGTATTVNVMVAFDAIARYEQRIKDIMLISGAGHSFQVGYYFGSRVDTGTQILNTWVAGATMYSYYFPVGGINVDFDKGWRSDGAQIAGIYWRVGGGDNFGIANGTTDNSSSASTSGAAVMLDSSSCAGFVRLTARNVKHEINTTQTPGLGVYTLLGCPSEPNRTQFFLDFEQVWMSPSLSVTNASGVVVSPADDAMLSLTVVNSSISGSGQGAKWTGLPLLARNDAGGKYGNISILNYSPPILSSAPSETAYRGSSAPAQLIGDTNINQLFQYTVQASDFLYSDTAYTVLPNGTTLYAGQILAPPSYWHGANGKRYAFDVVYQSGTTGTPNGGATTCSGTLGALVMTCTSATDLSQGQWLTINGKTGLEIDNIDATNSGAVKVYTNWNSGSGELNGTFTNQALTFSAPVLGPEIQLPTKSSSSPTTLTWSQGDMEQNSGAATNGVAAWVNVATGKPGKWAGIPLGDSYGKITASQLSSARTAQAFCAGTASSSSTLLLFGAGTSQTTCTQIPGPQTLQQVLLTTDGVLSNLAVRCGRAGSQPSSGTFTVWDLPSGTAMSNAASGTNTGLAVTIGNAAGNANKTLIDTRHTYAYAAGDMIRIQFTTQANETLGDCTASFNY